MNPTADSCPDASEYIRIFIAIDTNHEVKQKLGRIQEEFRKLDAGVRWVAPEIMHLTLVFLGDIPANRSESVSAAVTGVAAMSAPFSYDISGLGFFGSTRSPRAIWAGIGPCPPMAKLQQLLSTAVRDLGFAVEDRPFKPHLTIGRVRSIRNTGAVVQKIQSCAYTPFGRVQTDSVLLIRSRLKPQGPEYSVIHSARLGASS